MNFIEKVGTVILLFSSLEHLACVVIAEHEGYEDDNLKKYVYEVLYKKEVSSMDVYEKIKSYLPNKEQLHADYLEAKRLRDMVAHGFIKGSSDIAYKDIGFIGPKGVESKVDIDTLLREFRKYRNRAFSALDTIAKSVS